MIKCYADEIGKLVRVLPDRVEYRGNIWRAVEAQAQGRSGWKRSVGCIDDDTASNERNAMFCGNLGRNVRLHIDGSRPRLIIKLKLFRGAGYHGIRPHDVCVNGVWKDLNEALCPCAIGRNYVFAAPDTRRYDPIACNQIRCQPAGNSKTDDARGAARDRRAKSRPQPRALIANHRYPRTARDAGLKC